MTFELLSDNIGQEFLLDQGIDEFSVEMILADYKEDGMFDINEY